MTVIAWDGTTLAADRLVCHAYLKYASTKVFAVNGPRGRALVGFAGSGSRVGAMLDWYMSGADPATYPKRDAEDNSVMVCVERFQEPIGAPRIDGGPYMTGTRLRRYEGTGYAYPIESPLYADGSGQDVALAAMHCGRDAVQACELAGELLASCGLGVDAVRFDSGPMLSYPQRCLGISHE